MNDCPNCAELQRRLSDEKTRAEHLLAWKAEVDSHLIARGRATPETFKSARVAIHALLGGEK